MNGVIQADFARLRNSLNTSGIQKSNNALYQIISRLIDVSEQAQQLQEPFVLNVDPLGALNENPLKVRVDNSTIQINGANNLISIPAGQTVSKVAFSYTQADVVAANYVQVLAASGNNILITPLAFIVKSVFNPNKQYGASRTLDFGYGGAFTSKFIQRISNVIVGGLGAAVTYWSFTPITAGVLYDGVGGVADPTNQAIYMRSSAATTVGGGSGNNNTHQGTMLYSTMTGV